MKILRIIGDKAEHTSALDHCLLGIDGVQMTVLACREPDPESPIENWHQFELPQVTSAATTKWLAAYEGYASRADAIFQRVLELELERPDVILNQGGSGSAFLLREHWGPDLKIITFFERFPTSRIAFQPHIRSAGLRTSQAILRYFSLSPYLLDLCYCDQAFTYTVQQHSQLPIEWSQKVRIVPEPVQLPDPLENDPAADDERLVSIEAEGRALDPRTLHGVLRQLLSMLAEEKIKARFILLGKHPAMPAVNELLENAGASVEDAASANAATRTSIWRRATIHIHWTSPAAHAGQLLRAMAAGCIVCGTDLPPSREFIRHRRNGLLLSDLSMVSAASEGLAVLREPSRYARLREAAQDYIKQRHATQRLRPQYVALLDSVN